MSFLTGIFEYKIFDRLMIAFAFSNRIFIY